jgi:myo-inositol catabolism protein IolC
METLVDDNKLKELLKQAIIEVIEEKRETVHDILMEVIEDAALMRAIQEGENSGEADREEIFGILRSDEGNA